MLRVALDENFNMDIVRGVLRQVPEAQFISTLGAGLKRATDPEVLAWAAAEGCILLTHDVATMTKFAYDRLRDGLPMPGVFEVGHHVLLARAIDDMPADARASGKGKCVTCRFSSSVPRAQTAE